MTTYLAEKEIHVAGLQRTGQHAIIIWIAGHFNKVCFKNGMSPAGDRASRGFSPPWMYLDIGKKGFDIEFNKDKLVRKNQDVFILGTEYQQYGCALNPSIDSETSKMARDIGFDEFSRDSKNVLVIRSPWNQLASILSWKKKWYMKRKDRFIRGWKNSAREALGVTNNFPEPKIIVKYDDWFVNKKYRRSISKQLGIPFSDKGLNIVMPIGWGTKGSSFDRMEYKKNAQKMAVNDRWKKYKDNHVEFLDVLRMDSELMDMSRQLFGEFPFEL